MMNRGTGFITLTLADICPPGWASPRPVVMQRCFYSPEPPASLSVAVLGPQPYQVIAEHLLHPPVEVHDQP